METVRTESFRSTPKLPENEVEKRYCEMQTVQMEDSSGGAEKGLLSRRSN